MPVYRLETSDFRRGTVPPGGCKVTGAIVIAASSERVARRIASQSCFSSKDSELWLDDSTLCRNIDEDWEDFDGTVIGMFLTDEWRRRGGD